MLLGNQPTILIVDDDSAIRSTFSRIFKMKGYAVSVAGFGKEAIEKIRANRYDVALVDFSLPDMEGTQVLSFLQNASPATLKVMVTGRIHLEDVFVGADVFLAKPVDPQRLLGIIDTKLRDRNIEQ